jgi:hypothetical protein
MLMLRLLTFFVLVLAIVFASASCTTKRITASGAKHSGYTKFNFRLNNNQTSRASIYKRYIAHNRNFKEMPSGNKKSKSTATPNKRLLAQNN